LEGISKSYFHCGNFQKVQSSTPFFGRIFYFRLHKAIMSDTKVNGEKPSDAGSGYLEISEKGFGFLRTAANHFHPKPTDIFVTPDTIRRNFLREGSHVVGTTQPPHRGTSPQLKTVDKVCILGSERAAWFKDTEGNILCIHQVLP